MRSLFQKAFLLSLFALPFAAQANTLGLSPDSGSYTVGKTFPVNVYVTSTAQAVNAVSGTLSFPTDKLQVVSVSKASSILTLWVSEPTFSNVSGSISFEGVVPNPGFQGSAGRLITVNFKVIGSGAAAVKWTSGSELANDGSGTNILRTSNNAAFTLGGVSAPVVIPTESAPEQSSGGLKVTSDNFPDSRKWYAVDNGTFRWQVGDGVSAVRVLVGKQPNSIPTVVYDPPIDSKKIDNLEDGVWYFHLQAKDDNGWGTVTHYQFRVDTTPPESMSLKAKTSSDATDPRPKFVVSASDSISGIDHYTFQLDDASPVTWRDDGSGVWQPAAVKPGDHTLLAKAYDEAGNSAPASVDFHIEPIEGVKITYFTEKVSEGGSVVVRGTAKPNMKVKLTLSKSGILASDESQSQTVDADDYGAWSAALATAKLTNGAYNLTAVSVDSRGAQSLPTAGKTVIIGSGWLSNVGGTILKFLAVAVPSVALLIALILLFIHGFHRVKMTNKKFASELHNVERLVDKSFVLLKEDVEDSIRLLERTKSRRRLTDEEEAIIERLRDNLRDAEKVIHGEVRKIEREL
ncbi:hypothetical protein KW800_00045 [Candidatus Parcubacteria bacterium]|nr:hypothetical protein [Candidatus Parcubacteria bacterium]